MVLCCGMSVLPLNIRLADCLKNPFYAPGLTDYMNFMIPFCLSIFINVIICHNFDRFID